MRRAILLTMTFVLGVAAGAAIRFPQYYRAGYARGRASATQELQHQAVREGHAFWQRRPDGSLPNVFAWLPVRERYNADSVSQIPGIE